MLDIDRGDMIVDAFTYNGEDDLLAIRLKLLDSVVDRFVIVEADKTFTGIPKRQKFDLEKFKGYSEKIHYSFVSDLSLNPLSAWDNERVQRNSLIKGLVDLSDDDIFILSDVDEIPNPLAVLEFVSRQYSIAELSQGLYFYYLNNRAHDKGGFPVKWVKAVIVKFGYYNKYFSSLEDLRVNKHYGALRAFAKYSIKKKKVIMEEGGWHFTYLMTAKDIVEKLKSFSHSEVNTPDIANVDNIEASIKSGRDFFGHGYKFHLQSIDEIFPQEIINMVECKKWICDI